MCIIQFVSYRNKEERHAKSDAQSQRHDDLIRNELIGEYPWRLLRGDGEGSDFKEGDALSVFFRSAAQPPHNELLCLTLIWLCWQHQQVQCHWEQCSVK